MSLLLRDVDLPEGRADVRIVDGVVLELGRLTRSRGETVVDGQGGALLPGLHDHHLHLMATAAARDSVDVSASLDPIREAGRGWVRAVGWAGEGDRAVLDSVQPDRPVRVQHRSGALWVLNSRAIVELQLDTSDHAGVERDGAGRATGRLWRADELLAKRIGRSLPDLAGLGDLLASLGITGVTDATPDLDPATCHLLRESIPQHVQLLGDPTGSAPVKVVLADSGLPTLGDLVDRLRAIRPRPVAAHCVTRVALVLLLAALDEVGRVSGDRIEHAAVVPLELCAGLPAIVTQPGFLGHRGDDFRRDVPAADLPDLYRYRSLLMAGTTVVPSSDAPYGPIDPWRVLVDARDRRSPSGIAMSQGEGVEIGVALDGLLRPLADLSAPPRRVSPGAAADLVLLRVPRAVALSEPDAAHVRTTWIEGRTVHDSPA